MTRTRPLRVAFLGNDAWSVPALGALARSAHRVVAVVTAAPKPAGRGNELTPTPVAVESSRLDLLLVETDTVKAGIGFERLVASGPDVLAVVAYGEILPPAVLELPSLAPVNLHFSLLPELRGAAPVQAALLAGMTRTGVSTILMDAGLDTGGVLLARPEPIEADDDAGSLGARLADLGAEVLVQTIDGLSAGSLTPVPQDDRRATFAPKLRPQDRTLDWSRPAVDLVNLVRALSPEPAATTVFRGGGLKVFRAEALEGGGEPGTIVEVSKHGFVVATAEGGFGPLHVAPAGRRAMSVRDFVNGHRPRIGERLG
jgi:methionyl-tRNA formyltransferase